jgi:asparagine synthase (glutamine-hydrolysing)
VNLITIQRDGQALQTRKFSLQEIYIRMCGIAGIVLKQDTNDPSGLEQRLSRMNQIMRHRGPDDEGIYISPDSRIGLANRRLAIRDLSVAGHMPMLDAQREVCITYNGEIYNADRLRAELQALGHIFRSDSDTEVILEGYKEWGQAVLPRLRGMFAFAIYDQRPGIAPVMLLARDHMGIKPLYYAETPTAFLFASEIKVLLASGLTGSEISPAGLTGYLLTGSVPNPLTIYRGVQSLPPASLLSFETASMQICSTTFWHLPQDTSPISSIDEAAQMIRDCLLDAVKTQLVSDVPLGAFLSGGLDSSTVVALMRRITSGDIRTCSMVFEEITYSEAPYAQAVAQAVGSNHYERVITAVDVLTEFDAILNALDQPSNDGVNTYFVSQTARQAGLTVALSGLGGDELFGGYPNTFHDVPRIRQALRISSAIPVGSVLAKAALKFLPERRGWGRISDALDQVPTLSSAYWTRRGLFAPTEVKTLLHPDWWQTGSAAFDMGQHVAQQAGVADAHAGDVFAWISRAELRTYTHHQLLRDTDVMSMAHSLEVRVPLLDHLLVETALRLPEWVKIGDNRTLKSLLLRAVKDDLPPLVATRRTKQGFTFPFDIWLRGALRERVRDVLQQVKQQPWMNAAAVDSTIQQYEAGTLHWSRIWALVALGCVG